MKINTFLTIGISLLSILIVVIIITITKENLELKREIEVIAKPEREIINPERVRKEKLINNLLASKHKSIDFRDYDGAELLTIYYQDVAIKINHYHFVPYEKKETWNYSIVYLDGSTEIFGDDYISEDNHISKETHLKLKNKLLEIQKHYENN